MKIDKKIVALSIFALVIGIAAVIPTAYLMDGKGIGATAQNKPWFNVDIQYANTMPDTLGRNGDIITVAANFIYTNDAVNLRDADAKIEVFNFHVYSDQISIANITYCISLTGNIVYPQKQNSATLIAVKDLGDGCYMFADGTLYNVKDAIGYTEGIFSHLLIYATTDIRAIHFDENGEAYVERGPEVILSGSTGNVTALLSEDKGERSAQALINLRNAQTLYIDVTRVITVTYKHQATSDSTVSSLMTTLANSEILCHIGLTKTGFGFTYGAVSDIARDGLGGIVTSFEPTSLSTSAQMPVQAGLINSFLRKLLV